MAIPKIKFLVGHTKKYDIYSDRKKGLYSYSGTKLGHWVNPKFWKKL